MIKKWNLFSNAILLVFFKSKIIYAIKNPIFNSSSIPIITFIFSL